MGVGSSSPLRVEVLAALTAVGLLAPETVAFSLVAGVPPAAGLAAAPLCLLVFALTGQHREVLVGSTAATAVITSAAILPLAPDGPERAVLAAALALLTGAVLFLTGMLRCGFLARFLAPATIQGFLFGLAVVILVRQLAVMVDVQTTGNVFGRVRELLESRGSWQLVSLATGLTCVAALFVLETRLPRVPATVVVLVLAAVGSALLGLAGHGVAHVAGVPAGLPQFRVPDLERSTWLHLVGSAGGLALIVFSLGHGVALKLRDPGGPPPDADREMLALGLANLVAGAFGGASVTGSPAASAAARSAGGRSRGLPVLCSGALLIVALWLTPLFRLLPEPALAAVVIMAVRPFLTLRPLRGYLARDRRNLAVSVSAIFGVVTFTLVPGLLLAVLLSLTLFIADASRLRVSQLGRTADERAYLALERNPGLTTWPGVALLRPDGPLFFANVDRAVTAVECAAASNPHSAVVLDLGATFELGLDVIDALIEVRERLERDGGRLIFVHLYLGAADAIRSSSLVTVPAYRTLDAAVAGTSVRDDQMTSADP